MENKYIPIVNREEACKVYIDDVLMLEQDLRKTFIHTEGEKFWRYGKIEELAGFLDSRFFKCHKSYIINMDQVVKMKDQTIFFKNGETIMIGRDKFKAAKQNFAGRMANETRTWR